LSNRGYLIYLDGNFNVGKNYKVGLSFGRGSGDDDPTDNFNRNFGSLFMDETGFTYTNLYADDVHGYDGTNASVGRGAGFANTTFAQLHGEVRPNERLRLELSYTWLRVTEPQPVGSGVLGLKPPTGAGVTKHIGSELDFDADYSLTKDTRLFLRSGFFFPGRIFGVSASSAQKIELGVETSFSSLIR
jgi:hypothetical protein